MTTFWIVLSVIALLFGLVTFVLGGEGHNGQTTEEAQKILDKCRYWDRWTGSRYVRSENPKWNDPKYDVKDCVARSNSVTGKWEIIQRV